MVQSFHEITISKLLPRKSRKKAAAELDKRIASLKRMPSHSPSLNNMNKVSTSVAELDNPRENLQKSFKVLQSSMVNRASLIAIDSSKEASASNLYP